MLINLWAYTINKEILLSQLRMFPSQMDYKRILLLSRKQQKLLSVYQLRCKELNKPMFQLHSLKTLVKLMN